jgi:hypothetical protein
MNKGLNEDEIRKLCNECKPSYSKWKYWTAELYSFGKYIRKYGFFPQFLPIYIYTDHGPGAFTDGPSAYELESTAEVQFYHSTRMVENWKKSSAKKPCYVLYSPAVFYRRKNKIEKLNQAEGTISFPAHTTPSIEDVSNIEIYIEQLKNLPAQFQPVSVCLHMHDINKGQHKIFMKHNIPVYTAGNSADPRFIERFYDILKNFKYSTSNMIGSYAYYSVEMGIPFSVYGNPQKFINNDDPNITKGEWNPYNEYEYYRKVYELFNDLNTEISIDQKDLVEKELGIYDGLSRFDMAKVLYKIYFKRGDLIKDFIDYLFNFLKEFRVKTRSFRKKFKFGNSKKTNS